MNTFTAWITTDKTCLRGDLYEIDVFEVDEFGAMTGDVAYTTIGSLPAANDDQDILAEARDLLADAGWNITGPVEATGTGTGYVYTVERD